MLASECGSVECPTDLPDWGSGTGGGSTGGGSTGGGSTGGGSTGGDSESGSDNAGTDSATGQFRLNVTQHGK